MKSVQFVILVVLAAQAAFAGDKIGNGGGLWACENPQQQIQSAVMVDLFEAQTEFGLSISPQPLLHAQDIAIQRSVTLKTINSAMTEKITKYLAEVFQKTQFVDAVLEKVDDALFRIEPLPSTCPTGQWRYVQFANFTYQNQVLIRNDIWQSVVVSEQDKAALLVHEAVYRWMRTEYSDTNSVRSRQIVGLLFSTLKIDEINSRIQALLGPGSEPVLSDTWGCMITNDNAKRSFFSLGQSKIEAQINVASQCAQKTTSFFCTKESAECEKVETTVSRWTCSVTNENSHRDFLGKGRTKLEATYQTIKSCEDASNGGFFCTNPSCFLQ